MFFILNNSSFFFDTKFNSKGLNVVKKMKEKAKEFKAAEGDEKEKIK